MSASTVAARRYAKALYELADETRQVDKVRGDLAALASALDASAELRAVMSNPAFTPDQKKNVIVRVAERLGAHKHVTSTLQLLVDRGRIGELGELSIAFGALAERRSGRVQAEVVSATPLDVGYCARLEKTLRELTGREVTLVKRTDPSLIGGIVTRIGDTVFDGSIANRLKDLEASLLA